VRHIGVWCRQMDCLSPDTHGRTPVRILQPRDARKLIHTLSAPLFMLVWPLFSSATGARWFAVIVPLLNAVRLWLAGAGSDNEEVSLAAAVSRSGDRKEAVSVPAELLGQFLKT